MTFIKLQTTGPLLVLRHPFPGLNPDKIGNNKLQASNYK
jgi:hypothetical protein